MVTARDDLGDPLRDHCEFGRLRGDGRLFELELKFSLPSTVLPGLPLQGGESDLNAFILIIKRAPFELVVAVEVEQRLADGGLEVVGVEAMDAGAGLRPVPVSR